MRRSLGVAIAAVIMVVGFATDIGAYGERRMAPRKPIPYGIRVRGGLPPTTVYAVYGRYGYRPTYRPYSRLGFRRGYRPAYRLGYAGGRLPYYRAGQRSYRTVYAAPTRGYVLRSYRHGVPHRAPHRAAAPRYRAPVRRYR